ncbi:probable RNA-binding protein EIF1AD isoform X2 [Amborella trichopoda]|uniref:probable RNA-binding protein EIF1AD isoform X2 n=1 Tax=Amborella trichopoda TaxID=13333 RepID=UPI0009BDDEFE|nr:probable RNA-binding protein EIF1AD isoform X2 [Amborella trichopoda]|eukprot:XP_020530261.1 probable RNA-binding protein EIF1AD isoform X2 [Amborella trichopoda]
MCRPCLAEALEVMDDSGRKSLGIFPAKFQKSIWIKRGNFVVVDGSGSEKALESGNKITCMISQVLFHEQVRTLQKSPDWPEIFRTTASVEAKDTETTNEQMEEAHCSSDDGLPPLEANLNRVRLAELLTDSSSDDSDS